MIKLYNTKTRTLEDFKPIHENMVGIYSCGPTVYHYQHLGNMRAAVFADTLHRALVSAGYKVNHVINITDVGHNVDDSESGEDKMEKGSRREGKSVWEIAKMYTDTYFSDLDSLNINLSEYTFPRATDNIPEQIEIVKTLEQKGYTYTISDGVYFDTSKFAAYADFAKLDIEGLKAGARVEENTDKRNITDFALWKFSPKNEKRQMEWDSPWGVGFPGWHIECSAMSMKYLGKHFDIHTGGIEHIPVHHTNEIAQSECANNEIYVNYWMHNNHLQDTTGKMSKSNGDFLTMTSLIEKGYPPLAYRYFLMNANYRKELAFSFEALDAATTAYKKLVRWVEEHNTETGTIHEGYKEKFLSAIYDDLGTPQAVAEIWNMLKDETLSLGDKYATLLLMSEVLGLGLEHVTKEKISLPQEVSQLLTERKIAREEKNFQASDILRDKIQKLGYLVKDTKDGQIISKI
jgi:cysteinyl-tRNA synthetase